MAFHPQSRPAAGRKTVRKPFRKPAPPSRSPMQAYVTAALRWTGTPLMPGPSQAYGPQLEISEAVRSGKRHPMAAYDRTLVREHQRGASFGWALNTVRAIRQSAAVIWGRLAGTADPVAVHVAETEAQCEADKLQARVFADLSRATDADLEQLEVLFDLQLLAIEDAQLFCAAERLRRSRARDGAHGALRLA